MVTRARIHQGIAGESAPFLGLYFLHLSKEDYTVQRLFFNIKQILDILLHFEFFGVRQHTHTHKNPHKFLDPFIHIFWGKRKEKRNFLHIFITGPF